MIIPSENFLYEQRKRTGESHFVGLKSNGTVVAVGSNEFGQCDVSGWKNIRLPSNHR